MQPSTRNPNEVEELPQDFDAAPPVDDGEHKAKAIELEMIAPNAVQEAKNLVEFLSKAKVPALVIAAIDTQPEIGPDGGERYATFQTAIGTTDALVQLIAWLTGNVMPALEQIATAQEGAKG